jgi:hypothetical protein
MAKEKPNILVTPHPDGGWQKKHEKSNRASRKFDKKQEAVKSAVQQAKRERVEVIIQREDGSIERKDSYGKDPNPPKDKK